MPLFNELLQGAFGYQPAAQPAPPAPPPLPPPEPEKKTYVTRDSIVRDNAPETMAAVQDLVWGQQNSPPPGAPGGLGQGMNKAEGWGKTGG